MSNFSKYNQAVLASDEQKNISEAEQIVNENQSELNKRKEILNKEIKSAAVSNSAYTIESVLSAKRKLREEELKFNQQKKIVENAKKEINSAKSSISTPEKLEQQGFIKEDKNNQVVYYKTSEYKRRSDDKNKIQYRSKEYIFSDDGTPIKFIDRETYSTGSRNKVTDEHVITFDKKGVVSKNETFDDGQRYTLQTYDAKGRITKDASYKDGDEKKEKLYSYDDQLNQVSTTTKDHEKSAKQKASAEKKANTISNTYDVYDNNTGTTSTRTLYQDGSFSNQTKKTDVYEVRLKTDTKTGIQTEKQFSKNNELIKTITKTPATTSTKVSKEEMQLKQTLTPEAQQFNQILNDAKQEKKLKESIQYHQQFQSKKQNSDLFSQVEKESETTILTTGGNVIRDQGVKMQNYKIDDSPDSFGYSAKKKIEQGVNILGAGVESFGEGVNFVDSTIVQPPQNLKKFGEQRGSDGEFGFKDTIRSFSDVYSQGADDVHSNSPNLAKVINKDLDQGADVLSSTGQKLKSIDFVDDTFAHKMKGHKERAVEKAQQLSDKGVEMHHSAYSDFDSSSSILDRVSSVVKQDAGIALTLAGESAKGVLTPTKTSKVTENALASVDASNKPLKFAANVAEIGVGGASYTTEIVSDPKTYIADEFEEAAMIAASPKKRGVEIVESVATNPKGFLKASLGETFFVTGAFIGAKAVSIEAQNKGSLVVDEIAEKAIDVKKSQNKKISESEMTFRENNPNTQVEYVSLDSVDVKLPKQQTRPQGIVTAGEYAYKTESFSLELPNLPNFHRPEIKINKDAKLTNSEIGVGFDYNSELPFKQDNKSELSFDNKRDSEIDFDFRKDYKKDTKFDHKTDLRTDHKTDHKTDTKTDHKTDFRTDYKTDYKTDTRTDHKTDRKTDFKFDYKLFGKGKQSSFMGGLKTSNKDDGVYISSLGGALLSKTTKNPIIDNSGLKIRAIKIKGKLK